jgi:hypothetical protein
MMTLSPFKNMTTSSGVFLLVKMCPQLLIKLNCYLDLESHPDYSYGAQDYNVINPFMNFSNTHPYC